MRELQGGIENRLDLTRAIDANDRGDENISDCKSLPAPDFGTDMSDATRVPSVMIPTWLLKSCRSLDLAHGFVLVYACLLRLAATNHLENGASFALALSADIATSLGLTASYVRRGMAALQRVGLIGRKDDFVLFGAHPTMGSTPVVADGLIDVEGQWSNDAFYLPATIACLSSNVLSASAKLFFAILRRYEKRYYGQVTAKQATLGSELGVGTRQVQTHVAQLERLGFIDVEDRRRYRRPNVIHTHILPNPLVGETRQTARARAIGRRDALKQRYK